MNTRQPTRGQLLDAYAALPEAYQPAWGFDETTSQARRACSDRLAALLPAIRALPVAQPLRILDIGCAQGYFTLALQHELATDGRSVEVVGVDYLDANVAFCRALAAHHGCDATFLCDHFDAGFFARHALAGFDVVLALNVLHHMHERDGEAAARAAMEAVRAQGRVLFCELAQAEENLDWIGARRVADEDLLAGYAFRRCLGRFPTHLTAVERPLYACSDSLAWVGDRWFGFNRVETRSHADVPQAFAGQRRFWFGAETLVKGYRGDGDFGRFNRDELAAEAENLKNLGGDPGRYPPLLAQADDGDVVWLARGVLPGRLLSTAMAAGEAIDRDGVVRALLEELVRLESHGLAHADLRCWNVLLQEREVRLIDFGSMVATPTPLQRVALAAVLLEIARGRLAIEQPFYTALHPLSAYPDGWHRLLCHLLETPQADYTCAGALRAFAHAGARTHAGVRPCDEVIAAVADEQAAAFRRLQEHATEAQRVGALAIHHGKDLERNLARQSRDADQEREASRADLARAAAYARDLERTVARKDEEAGVERRAQQEALARAVKHAEDLQCSLARATAHATELELIIARRAEEAEMERKSNMDALADAMARAADLERNLAHRSEEADGLRKLVASELRRAEAHAQAYDARLVELARTAKSLQQALRDQADRIAELDAERKRQQAAVARAEQRIEALQRRFRWLKPLWPRLHGQEEEGE